MAKQFAILGNAAATFFYDSSTALELKAGDAVETTHKHRSSKMFKSRLRKGHIRLVSETEAAAYVKAHEEKTQDKVKAEATGEPSAEELKAEAIKNLMASTKADMIDSIFEEDEDGGGYEEEELEKKNKSELAEILYDLQNAE